MFERYTETARRAVFFARHEASEFGSQEIETHHLLLALLREQPGLFQPWLKSPEAAGEIRAHFEQRFPRGGRVPTSVDLPLSHECGRVLAYAAEEAERLRHPHIGPEHLLLGLLREERSEAAATLGRYGVELAALRLHWALFVRKHGREELFLLVDQLPPERADAAARILQALGNDAVTISVASPAATFGVSFTGRGAPGNWTK